jgi:spermidine synthase
MIFHAIIFVTGAAVLSLELLASRVMTPYFGVSLYIWAGILSITLIALAVGYRLGGAVAARAATRAASDRLRTLFLLMPAIASLAIVSTCVAYPVLFPTLAAGHLVLGAFAGCFLMLFVPLVATSAMNPFLIAVELERRRTAGGDGGAGNVFFVSTVGSVAGVFATAFGLIPHLSNFVSLLIVAVVLALLPLLALASRDMPRPAVRQVAVTGTVALVVAGGLLVSADAFLGRFWPARYAGSEWHMEARDSSLFGTVKVLRSEGPDGSVSRYYFQDGLVQNRVDAQHRSLSFYTYALEALGMGYRPEAKRALVLGLGAGMVPMRLAARGIETEAVDIDPVAFRVAARHFGFDPTRVKAIEVDARTFLRDCKRPWDLIVVDLFHGDGMPDYLVTRDFFRDLRNCLGRDGVAVFNTFVDLGMPRPYAHFLATLRAELPWLRLYLPPDNDNHLNGFVVASAAPLPDPQYDDQRAGSILRTRRTCA